MLPNLSPCTRHSRTHLSPMPNTAFWLGQPHSVPESCAEERMAQWSRMWPLGQTGWVQILVVPFTDATLGKVHSFSVPQFIHL